MLKRLLPLLLLAACGSDPASDPHVDEGAPEPYAAETEDGYVLHSGRLAGTLHENKIDHEATVLYAESGSEYSYFDVIAEPESGKAHMVRVFLNGPLSDMLTETVLPYDIATWSAIGCTGDAPGSYYADSPATGGTIIVDRADSRSSDVTVALTIEDEDVVANLSITQ